MLVATTGRSTSAPAKIALPQEYSPRKFIPKRNRLNFCSSNYFRWTNERPYFRKVSWSLLYGFIFLAFGSVSFFTGHVVSHLDLYSRQFVKTRIFSRTAFGNNIPIDIWKSNFSNLFRGCSERGHNFPSPPSEEHHNGYLLIAASGGLNQQRAGIIDAVVVSRILNATLVIPELDHHSYWRDDSDFDDVFDVDWFISYLANDVNIIKRVPDWFMRSMEKPPYTMRVPRKSSPEYYLYQVLPILLRRHVVQLTKFDYRLANDLDDELQKLRCRVNFHALRYTTSIQKIGEGLLEKIHAMAKRFVAVHVRFEPDMLAFSGCYYGGGLKERLELGKIRKRWTTLPDLSYADDQGNKRCPLTPREVGLMLRALGFSNDTFLYVASGEIYGGENTWRPLRKLFPILYTKEMLTSDELKPLLPFSSRLAAIDFIVCYESDVFVSNYNGNMAKILAGQRRYAGHRRTIRPNTKRLHSLLQAQKKIGWTAFSNKVKAAQRGFMGEPHEMRPSRGDFLEYPLSCICEQEINTTLQTGAEDAPVGEARY